METLFAFLAGEKPISYYFMPLGYFGFSWQPTIDAIIAIYESSPALASFTEQDRYKHMTKREVAALAAGIMRVAGVQGGSAIMKIVIGAWNIGNNFDQSKVWDGLNLDDDGELHKYIMECIRLDPPVTVVHRVATEDFTVSMQGSEHTFPTGTTIGIPLALASRDPAFWGSTALEFDKDRPTLLENSIGFNSVGDHSAGRACPGKKLVLDMLVEVLKRLGTQRRLQRSLDSP